MKVISISGKAGSGKDTVSGMIHDELINSGYSVLIIHFADLLKYILKEYFGWDGVKNRRGRYLLQYIGTDVVRKADENFWANFVVSFLKFFGMYWDYAIVPDARFPNEIEILSANNRDFCSINVVNTTPHRELTNAQMAHESETALDNYKFDVTLSNDGTLDDLREKVKQIVSDYIM